ncbi:unnamed protein product [Effrenium voratum]|nr:unnamed protein product [Effrenium voratum]
MRFELFTASAVMRRNAAVAAQAESERLRIQDAEARLALQLPHLDMESCCKEGEVIPITYDPCIEDFLMGGQTLTEWHTPPGYLGLQIMALTSTPVDSTMWSVECGEKSHSASPGTVPPWPDLPCGTEWRRRDVDWQYPLLLKDGEPANSAQTPYTCREEDFSNAWTTPNRDEKWILLKADMTEAHRRVKVLLGNWRFQVYVEGPEGWREFPFGQTLGWPNNPEATVLPSIASPEIPITEESAAALCAWALSFQSPRRRALRSFL